MRQGRISARSVRQEKMLLSVYVSLARKYSPLIENLIVGDSRPDWLEPKLYGHSVFGSAMNPEPDPTFLGLTLKSLTQKANSFDNFII